MSRIKPSDVLLIGIISNIIYILFKDTVSVHEIVAIRNEYWTTILLIILIISSVPLLWNSSSNLQNNLLNFSIIMSITASLLNIFDFSFGLFGYNLILNLISMLTLLSLIKVQAPLSRIYFSLLLFMFFDFQTLLYESLSNDTLFTGISVIFEGIFIVGISYYFYKSKFNRNQSLIIFISGIAGIALSTFILTKDTPLLILRTVIEQTLGIREFAIDLYLFEITKDIVFILHITEFLVLISLLILNRPSILLLTIILTGFDMTYPPLAGFRAVAIMYQLNRNDPNVNRFDALKTSSSNREKYNSYIENFDLENKL